MKALSLLAFVVLSVGVQAQTIFTGAGASAAAVQPVVDGFRASLGSLNANLVGSVGSGRREINWDGVPDGFSAPNTLPANFFNANSPRGVVFSTPGTGFQVSSTTASGTPTQFGNLDPVYPQSFTTFSAERLFTPLQSTISDVSFFIPGTATPALTTGFGAVFTDVDLANISSIQFFDGGGFSLGTYFVPAIAGGNETLSFLGVVYGDAVVSRVRITSGNQILTAGGLSGDFVAMDDFIYGEPRNAPVATPDAGSTLALFALGLSALALSRFRRRGKA